MNIDEFIARSNEEGGEARPRSTTSAPERSKATKRTASSQRKAAQAPRQRQDTPRRDGKRSGGSILLIALLVLVALVLGFLLFRYVFGSGGSLSSKLQLSEGELNQVVATYTVGGKKTKLTARDVLEHEGMMSGSRNEDGTYDSPSADAILACVRGMVVAKEAERKGIAVTDADVDAYAQATLGTSDYATIASGYGQTEEEVRAQLKEAALMSKLRDKVVTEADAAAPAMPPEPGVGEEVSLTEDYANYVIALVGSEWDSTTGTWASPDGRFATALADYEISATGASYEAALQAYWVAYQDYVDNHSEAAEAWDSYLNGLLTGVRLELGSVAV